MALGQRFVRAGVARGEGRQNGVAGRLYREKALARLRLLALAAVKPAADEVGDGRQIVDIKARQACLLLFATLLGLIAGQRYDVPVVGEEQRFANFGAVQLDFREVLVLERLHQQQIEAGLIEAGQ